MLRYLWERITRLHRPIENEDERLSGRFFWFLCVVALLGLPGFFLFAAMGVLSATILRDWYYAYDPAGFSRFAKVCFRIGGYLLLFSSASFVLAHVGGVILDIWEELVSRARRRNSLTFRECLRKELDFERWAE